MPARSRPQWQLRLLGFLASLVYGLVTKTVRPVLGADAAEIQERFHGPDRIIMAFWHQQLACIGHAYEGPGQTVPISLHGDGEIVARAMAPFNIEAARGSSTRGGTASLRGMIRAFRSGRDLGITPDGPKGPRYVAKLGVVQVAAALEAPIYPTAAMPERCWIARKSWDRFVVPFPFSRVHYAVGEPIRVARGSDEATLEAARLELEVALRELTKRAEVAAGQNTA